MQRAASIVLKLVLGDNIQGYHNVGESESSNWLELYDQSEIIRGLYNKSKNQENLVIARHPPAEDRCRDGKEPPLSRLLLLPVGAEDP